jgi:hypothetical protein
MLLQYMYVYQELKYWANIGHKDNDWKTVRSQRSSKLDKSRRLHRIERVYSIELTKLASR